MKILLKGFVLFACIFSSCGGNNSIIRKSPEELKRELKTEEHLNYGKYLIVQTNRADYKFWTDNYSIKGYINSSASLARFKDIVLKVTFKTETDTELNSIDFTLYKFIEPNSKTDFEIRTKIPSACRKYNVQIKTVVPVD
jgi:hypothetical protein